MIHAEDLAGGLWHVELQRPEKRNALCDEAYVRLAKLLRTLSANADTRVIILSGEGDIFCAGTDIREFPTHWPQAPEGPVLSFLQALFHCEVPIIAAVRGAAVGVGATLLLHCDIVIIEPDAYLLFPFVDLGVTVEGGGSYLLPSLMGHTRAMDALLTGRRIPAAEAFALGLVSMISEDEPALEVALRLGREVAGKPPDAVRTTKRLLRRGMSEIVRPRFTEEVGEINRLLQA